jgi:hypothetical protein
MLNMIVYRKKNKKLDKSISYFAFLRIKQTNKYINKLN